MERSVRETESAASSQQRAGWGERGRGPPRTRDPLALTLSPIWFLSRESSALLVTMEFVLGSMYSGEKWCSSHRRGTSATSKTCLTALAISGPMPSPGKNVAVGACFWVQEAVGVSVREGEPSGGKGEGSLPSRRRCLSSFRAPSPGRGPGRTCGLRLTATTSFRLENYFFFSLSLSCQHRPDSDPLPCHLPSCAKESRNRCVRGEGSRTKAKSEQKGRSK